MSDQPPAPPARQLEALLPDLLRLAIYLLRDRPTAEDVVQDIVLRLWIRLQDPAAAPVEDLRSYAFTALRNRLRNGTGTANSPLDIAPDPLDPSPDGATRLACAQTLEALDRLPSDQAQLLRLRAMDGLSYSEIAHRMNLPEGTVTSRLSRARAALRAALDLPPGAPVTFLME